MDKIYLVRYSGGSWDDYYSEVIFATSKKTKATKYVTKFNKMLKKWKEYYKQFEETKFGVIQCVKDEYVETHFHRWDKLKNIDKCYYEKIPIR